MPTCIYITASADTASESPAHSSLTLLLLLLPPKQLYAHPPSLQGGTSNAAFWQSSHEADFSRTPLGVNEYRMEVYHPPYEFRPNRPRFTTRPPTFVPYGSSFEVGYAFDEPADIAGVVLVNAGGVSGTKSGL